MDNEEQSWGGKIYFKEEKEISDLLFPTFL
jgi:hypothetical protein